METDFERYNRENRRLELLHPALTQGTSITHPRALQHLKEGFNRRLLMIGASTRAVHERVYEAGAKPLSPLFLPEFAIHVNAFWLNVCGALDNLAWALQYELEVLHNVDEMRAGREGISLFRKNFQRALMPLAPELVATLKQYGPWYDELRNLRDPAAHRIPIYPVPGVLTEAEGAQTQRLYDEADSHFKAGRLDRGMELLHEGTIQGVYQPWIALSHEGKTELFHLLPLVQRDDDSFVAVARAVLAVLFRSTGSK